MIPKAAVLTMLLSGLLVLPALSHQARHVEEISRVSEAVPDVPLVDQHGMAVDLPALLGDAGTTVIVTFTYTRCKSLCPVIVPIAIDAARKLEKERPDVRLVVLTVDPQNDGSAELLAHADAIGAGADDLFVTGEVAGMRRTLAVFGLTSRDPEAHPPLILARQPGRTGFLRIVVGDTSGERILEAIRGQAD